MEQRQENDRLHVSHGRGLSGGADCLFDGASGLLDGRSRLDERAQGNEQRQAHAVVSRIHTVRVGRIRGWMVGFCLDGKTLQYAVERPQYGGMFGGVCLGELCAVGSGIHGPRYVALARGDGFVCAALSSHGTDTVCQCLF